MTAQQQRTIDLLKSEQDRLSKPEKAYSNERMARDLHISLTTWVGIREGTYKIGAEEGKVSRQLQAAADRIERAREARVVQLAALGGKNILDTTDVRDLLMGIRVAAAEPGEDRLVLFLAPTGGGKSWAAERIKSEYSDRCCVVRADKTWGSKSGYRTAALRLLEGLGVNCENYRTEAETARAVIAAIRERSKADESFVLVIDEGNYFGPHSINLVKDILNETRAVVVLMAIPALWDWIVKRAYSEASQLKRRVAAMIHVQRMLAVDAELFLKDRVGCQGVDARALAACCEAGSEFGGWKLLEKVAKLLRAQECENPTLQDVVAALSAAKSQWTWR